MENEKRGSGLIPVTLEKLGKLLPGRGKQQMSAEKPEIEVSIEVVAESEIMAEDSVPSEAGIDQCSITYPWKSPTVDKEYSAKVQEKPVKERRIIRKRGFDVIKQVFFVYESVLESTEENPEGYWREKRQEFTEFDEFDDYLNGDIYENACYFQCDFSKINRSVDVAKMNERLSFLDGDFEYYNQVRSEIEEREYLEVEKRKEEIHEWVERFLECETVEELIALAETYRFSGPDWSNTVDLSFFFWNYIFVDPDDNHRFETVMQYMSTGRYPERVMIRNLCHVYGPEKVLEHCDYASESNTSKYKHRRQLRRYIDSLAGQDPKVDRTTEVFFHEPTHYYCEQDSYGVRRYFETLDELLIYRNNDLRNANLSDDIELAYDLANCITDATTVLPLHITKNTQYEVNKEYCDDEFTVTQMWLNENHVPVKIYVSSFQYFFNFVAFLKGDLSGANLAECKGLINLTNISGLNLDGARCSSEFCEKFGIPYDRYQLDKDKLKTFPASVVNEQETVPMLELSRVTDAELSEASPTREDIKGEKIYYISDLHLMHKMQHANVKSIEDVRCELKKIVGTIVCESNDPMRDFFRSFSDGMPDRIAKVSREIILIGGDVSSDFVLFEMFLKALREEFDRKSRKPHVVFVLGNHELWDFQNISFEITVEKYRNTLSQYGMHLLQNNMLYLDQEAGMQEISTEELKSLSDEEFRAKVRTARAVLFGGLAFSGCNEEFNAEQGIYRGAISRDEEIAQSKAFERLYERVLSGLPDRRVVIFTHTPIDCWSASAQYHKNYVYVSGHTHRNLFYDDGEIRVYADNQIGYVNNNPHMKWFELDNEYDFFADFEDGIYKINRNDYLKFFRGKNISIQFNRKIHVLYMLKKMGYYCFIHQSKTGSLSILNGGSLKKLEKNDIKYYYDNIDAVIGRIRKPLDKYTAVQEKIAEEVRRIGGRGTIHGCIIDIDFYNHIYLNPEDWKQTAYWASDIVNKKVYASVPALLIQKCPQLYLRYQRLLEQAPESIKILSETDGTGVSVIPQTELATDIYRISREIKKMQKLSSNILCIWPEAGMEAALMDYYQE